MFSRKNIGSEPQKCEKCGSDKVYFVQHSHGNYPILDYVCPKCDLGGVTVVSDWWRGSCRRGEDACGRGLPRGVGTRVSHTPGYVCGAVVLRVRGVGGTDVLRLQGV